MKKKLKNLKNMKKNEKKIEKKNINNQNIIISIVNYLMAKKSD